MLTAKLLLISICLCLALTIRNNVKLTSNYNASSVRDFASIALPLEVPLSIPKLHDPNPISYTSINQKYSIGLYSPSTPNLQWGGLNERMVHIDYAMIYEQNPPLSIFEDKYDEQYHLLETRQFYITVANPSQILTICINEIFSDCDSIKKVIKKSFPICINPFTKYPINFNLYVTHSRNRQYIKSAIFFNVTFKYQNNPIYNRMWMRQVKFNLHPNHLKLLPFQIRNCQTQNSYVTIKNPQKHDLSIMIIHKFKKYHTNGQPLDDKFTIGSQKTFRFMLEAKDSTMTIYTRTIQNIDKSYPVLYVPVYCYDKAIIENIPIGTIYSNRMALTYPILLTSNTNSVIIVQEISLISSSNTIQLVRAPTHKVQIQSIQRYAQIASFVVKSANRTSFRNSVTIKVKFSLSNAPNSNNTFEIKKIFTYCQLYGAIEVGENRFYQINKLPDHQYNETEKIRHFNYSIINKMQIPIKMQRILFNSQKFKMHWFRYTALHIFPQRSKQQIMLQYIGPKQIPISPIKYAAAIDFTGGIFIPFEVLIFDRTLACLYQGKQIRCSTLKYINFGYQKNQQKIQNQTIMFRNFNPHNITISIKNLQNMTKQFGLSLSLIFSEPFPYYHNYLHQSKQKSQIILQSGHYINVTIQMRIQSTPLSGQTLLQISTEYEQFTAKIKFNFQEGKLYFTPKVYQIDHFDRQHQGALQLLSTFQDIYQIRQIISDTTSLEFFFNQSHQYEPNQKIGIPFIYNPYRDDNNLTNECCSQQFLKSYYLYSLIHYEQSFAKSHNVTIITNTDFQQHLNIKVDIQKANLLSVSQGSRHIAVSALKIGSKAKVCLQIDNPYPSTLKYNVFFIPQEVVYKPKGFFDYLKHARREKVDAYICFVAHKKSNQITNILKNMFKLQENPTKLQINVDSMGNIDFSSSENNLSSNQYVNAIVQTGQESCYKINTYIYFKLLIQSQIINAILEQHSLQTLQKFIQKQWEYLHNSSLSYIDDEFYKDLKIKFQHHCNSVFFPIFRFCFYYPISLQSDKHFERQRKPKQSQSFYIQPRQSQQICFTINNPPTAKKQASFEMVIANNYSRYDDYKLQLSLVQPKISVGNIAFQRNHQINHQVFVKHYFAALAKANNQQLLRQGIQSRHKIIPIYLTNQDYEEQFGLFKGQRFFEIFNESPMDINFTHFGFQNKENISQWSGLMIQQVQPNGSFIQLTKNNKSVFKISLCLGQPYEFNLTNPYFHKKINLYLYKDDQFYLSLTLLLRVADNVIQKIKVNTLQTETQGNRIGYIFLNLLSFAYICMVITNLRREETQKYNKIKTALQKQKKIIVHKKQLIRQSSDVGFIEQKINKNNHILRPQAIGYKIKGQQQAKYAPCHIISQQQIHFYKSLNVEKQKSVISESSDDLALKFTGEQVQRGLDKSQDRSIRAQEKSQKGQQKSQKGQSGSIQRDSHEQSQQNDIWGQSDLQSQESEHSISQSILPDGISVCNEQLDTLDEFQDFQFGFEPKRGKKQQKIKKQQVYYDVFSNHNPLKKVKEQRKENPFPWMKQNEKSKPVRPKKIKKEQI